MRSLDGQMKEVRQLEAPACQESRRTKDRRQPWPLSLPRAWVPSLVGELRSHEPHRTEGKKPSPLSAKRRKDGFQRPEHHTFPAVRFQARRPAAHSHASLMIPVRSGNEGLTIQQCPNQNTGSGIWRGQRWDARPKKNRCAGSGRPRVHTRVPTNQGKLMVCLQVPDMRGKNGGSPVTGGRGRERRLEQPEARDSPADLKHDAADPVSLSGHLGVP